MAPPPRLAEIYEAEFGYVWNSLLRLGVPRADLEDLAQEVFVRAQRALPSFDPARRLRPWLFGVAFRVASDHRRMARHQREVPGEPPAAADPAPSPEEQVAAGQDRALVLRALRALEPDRLAVFVMHDLDGYSMPEIAREIDAPLNTLYSRLRLARADFAQAVRRLRPEEDSHG